MTNIIAFALRFAHHTTDSYELKNHYTLHKSKASFNKKET